MRFPGKPPLAWSQPDLLGEGQEAFRSGGFRAARALWKAEALASSAYSRDWIEGLSLVAAGFQELEDDRPRRAERLLAKGLQRLQHAPGVLDGIDVAAVRRAAIVLRVALRRGDPASARLLAAQPAV